MGQGVKVACEVGTEQFEGDLRAGLSDGVAIGRRCSDREDALGVALAV